MKPTTALSAPPSTDSPQKKGLSQREKLALEAQLREDTLYLLEIIWSLTEQESFESLALRAGLSTATIYRLWGGVWQRPQLLTIQKLALACGLNVSLTRSGLVVGINK